MSETVWADRQGGGQVPFDPETCERFLLRVDGGIKHYLYLHRKPGGAVLIYAEERPAMRRGRNPDTGQPQVGSFILRLCRVVTRTEADGLCREVGKDFPPEWEDRLETEPAGPGRKPLPARLELILDVFKTHGSGPHRGKDIAAKVRLPYNSALREDLAELQRLDHLDHDGRGYLRTDKPYP
jgi:hypothetical protein